VSTRPVSKGDLSLEESDDKRIERSASLSAAESSADKSRAVIGQSVNLVQPRHETMHRGAVEWTAKASDVDLSDVILRHAVLQSVRPIDRCGRKDEDRILLFQRGAL
jgi:hypothetical protein